MYKNNEIDYMKYLKKKELLIWGTGKRGRRVLGKLRKMEMRIRCLVDNAPEKIGSYIDGVEVMSFEQVKEILSDQMMIIICSAGENEIKRQLLDCDIFNFISELQMDLPGGESHYDKEYFEWQRPLGEFGAKIKKKMFEPYIVQDMCIVEFGSGGGYLLNEIHAKEKIGIELNDIARENALKLGINSVKTIDEIQDGFADLIISTSVLEHVENPFEVLTQLRRKIKDGGMAIFHVPNESCDTEYSRNEFNNHLYTWNCLNIGNLFKAAGYFVQSVEKIQEEWPEEFEKIASGTNEELFDELCRIRGEVRHACRCLIVAYK